MIVRELSNAIFNRVHAPRWAHLPLSGMGPARRGGRFNRPQQEALYLAHDELTALAEYRQDNPWLPPGTICSYRVDDLRVADLSAGYSPEHWSPQWVDHDCDWRRLAFNLRIDPPTWYMADEVLDSGLDGILFPSVARQGGTNLVVFDSSRCVESQLRVIDPGNLLPRNPSSWGGG